MINYLKYRGLYLAISAVVILTGIWSVAMGGLKYSVEFTGGTNIEYQVDTEKTIQKVKTRALNETEELNFKKELEKKHGKKINVLKSETIGPTLGRELIRKTIIASIIGILVILLYITYAFKNLKFAFAAIGALVHDIAIVFGIYSLLGRFYGAEVDALFVTALLTTMSFSVHDTIVIFDKIRELRKYEGRSNLEDQANRALNTTMVRSINNSLTIIFMLASLLILGGTTIKFFIAALLIGTITGTYSSPFVATPLLLLLEKKKK